MGRLLPHFIFSLNFVLFPPTPPSFNPPPTSNLQAPISTFSSSISCARRKLLRLKSFIVRITSRTRAPKTTTQREPLCLLAVSLLLDINRRRTPPRKAIGPRETGHEQPAALIAPVAAHNVSLDDLAHVSRPGATSSAPRRAAARGQGCGWLAGSRRIRGQRCAPDERFDGHAAVLAERHVDGAQLAENVSVEQKFPCLGCGDFPQLPVISAGFDIFDLSSPPSLWLPP